MKRYPQILRCALNDTTCTERATRHEAISLRRVMQRSWAEASEGVARNKFPALLGVVTKQT